MRALTLGVAFLVSFAVIWVAAWTLFWGLGRIEGVYGSAAGLGAILGESLDQLRGVFLDRDTERRLGFAVATMLALAQVAFISPLVGPMRVAPTGKPMLWTVLGASLMAGALTWVLGWSVVWAVECLAFGQPRPGSTVVEPRLTRAWLHPVVLMTGWLVCGAAWTWILRRSIASADPDTIARFARRLLAGSCLELVLGLPLYLLVRKRTECICGAPNFWSILIGLLGLVWLCGPAVILLLTQDARRRWRTGACGKCGYPLRAGTDRCSECGWSRAG